MQVQKAYALYSYNVVNYKYNLVYINESLEKFKQITLEYLTRYFTKHELFWNEILILDLKVTRFLTKKYPVWETDL